jgi:hypothetical protein
MVLASLDVLFMLISTSPDRVVNEVWYLQRADQWNRYHHHASLFSWRPSHAPGIELVQ